MATGALCNLSLLKQAANIINLSTMTTATADDADVVRDVIVVGAGVSGLAAAAVLSKAGLHVEVLEARERIGGRIDVVLPAGNFFRFSSSSLGDKFMLERAKRNGTKTGNRPVRVCLYSLL